MHYLALPTDTVRALQSGALDAYENPPEHSVSDGHGNPCRHCLQDIPKGAGMLIFGGVLLLIGTVIGRPYCRFLCPYGVLLGWMSRFSFKHVPVTPDVCIQCKLCEDACPFGCINTPTPDKAGEPRGIGIRRLAMLLVLLPVLVIGGGLLGSRLDRALMGADNSAKLVDQVLREDQGLTRETTLASERFRAAGKSTEELIAETGQLRGMMQTGGGWLGAFMGLVISGKLIGLSLQRKREDYETDRTTCYSCARCFRSCPREFVRLGLPPPEILDISTRRPSFGEAPATPVLKSKSRVD